MDLIRSYFKFVEYNGKVHCFASSGIDVYRKDDWTLLASASLATSCGAVNDFGVWAGTSNNGVFLFPHNAVGDMTSRKVRKYGSDIQPLLLNSVVYDMDGGRLSLNHRHPGRVRLFFLAVRRRGDRRLWWLRVRRHVRQSCGL